MQPLESLTAFDAELASLGFVQALEGAQEAAILRRLSESEPLRRYLTGGMYPVESEEAADVQIVGGRERALYLVHVNTQEQPEPGDWAQMFTEWLVIVDMERLPEFTTTRGGRRTAIVREIKTALRGSTHGVLYDADDQPLNEALIQFTTLNAPERVADLVRTGVRFRLTSDIEASSQEFLP